MNRRNFLKMTGGGLLATPFLSRQVWAAEAGMPLPIPPILDVDGIGGTVIDAVPSKHNFGSLRTTPTLGFSQSYLGPTLRMKRGHTAKIKVGNRTNRAITAHWHGLHVPGSIDGGPQLAFAPGQTWSPELEIDQPASTLWYHSHVHGETADQVYAGLAGMLLIDDPQSGSDRLPADYGVDDLPLIIQDKAFDDAANLIYIKRGPSLMHGFRANQIIVNGAVRPAAVVPAGLTRLRILNASNARIYHFRFEDDRTFHQIASDGGLLPAPISMTELSLAPAERAEILVDFGSAEKVRLLSGPDLNDPMGGGMMGRMMGRMMGGQVASPENVEGLNEFEVMTFIPDRARASSINVVPSTFSSSPRPNFGEPIRRRTFRLDMHAGGGMMMRGGTDLMGINGRSMAMDRIDEKVRIGETEVWEVIADEMAHPFHVHGTSFQVLSQNGKNLNFDQVGMKDVFLVDGRAEILVQFNQPASPQTPYMYHCHILEHEDAGMMGQFTVT